MLCALLDQQYLWSQV